MMSSTSNSNTQERNWLELPSDVMANILKRIGMIDILENAENVCTVWREICINDPTLWTVIDMMKLVDLVEFTPIENLCMRLVDRSQGQLVGIRIVDVYNHDLLLHVARRSSQLRCLIIVRGDYYIGESLCKALMKFPLLEELRLCFIKLSKEIIESAARYCPMLRTLKIYQEPCTQRFRDNDEKSLTIYNEIAVAIGENLCELRHLEITGNNMSNRGLEAILDGCQHLETLHLRRCFYIDLKGDLGQRCSKQIKDLKLSEESLENYYDSEDEDNDRAESPEFYDGYISH